MYLASFDFKLLAFTLKSMKVGEISEPMLTYDEKGSQVYKLVNLVSYTPEHTATLVDDYSDVKEMALEAKKHSTLNAWMRAKVSQVYMSVKSEEYQACDLKFED